MLQVELLQTGTQIQDEGGRGNNAPDLESINKSKGSTYSKIMLLRYRPKKRDHYATQISLVGSHSEETHFNQFP